MANVNKIRVGATDYTVYDSKALHLPDSKPTATVLVAVDATNAQANLALGEGLVLDEGVLSATATGTSLALGETSDTAYAGDKGKQNADDIAALTTRVDALESGGGVTAMTTDEVDAIALEVFGV